MNFWSWFMIWFLIVGFLYLVVLPMTQSQGLTAPSALLNEMHGVIMPGYYSCKNWNTEWRNGPNAWTNQGLPKDDYGTIIYSNCHEDGVDNPANICSDKQCMDKCNSMGDDCLGWNYNPFGSTTCSLWKKIESPTMSCGGDGSLTLTETGSIKKGKGITVSADGLA